MARDRSSKLEHEVILKMPLESSVGGFEFERPPILLIMKPIQELREGIRFPYPVCIAGLEEIVFYCRNKEHILKKSSEVLVDQTLRAFSLVNVRFSKMFLHLFKEVTNLSESPLDIKRKLSTVLRVHQL